MTVRMMTLQAVQAMVTKSCDFAGMTEPDEWLHMMSYKSSDTGFGHLVESMLTHGWDASMPIPIIAGCISEAHHRLTAAIMLCMDEIPVVDNWDDWTILRNEYWRKKDQGIETSIPDLSAHGDYVNPYPIPYE